MDHQVISMSEEERRAFLAAMLERRPVTVRARAPDDKRIELRGVPRNLEGDLLLLDLGDSLAGVDLDWVSDVRVTA
jgi:hypothetical protein